MASADIRAGKAYVELYVKNSAFYKAMQGAQQRVTKFGSDMQAMGKTLVGSSAAMIAPLAVGVLKFATFDDAMRQVAAVSGATGDKFTMLTEKAKELGRNTSFTAVEVASLMTELGRAGFNPDQINAMTGAVLNLARATGTDATLSSGIMAATIRQFALNAEDAGRVADAFTTTANKTFNTVGQLGEALNYAGPVAADFNMSLEDTLAVLGGLGNVGIQASNAGTALRRLLTINAANAGKFKELFGVDALDAAGNVRPLVDVLGEVNEASKDMATGERAAKFDALFGLLGITSASAIGNNVGDIKTLSEALKVAEGSAEKTAAAMDAGLGGAFRILLSALEGVQIALGEALEGAMTDVAKAATGVLGAFTAFVDKNQDAIKTFAKVALVVGGIGSAILAVGLASSAIGVALGGLIAMVGAIATGIGLAISTVGAVIGVIMSPIGLLIGGLAAIGYYVLSTTGLMNGLLGAATTMGAQFAGMFAGMQATFATTFEGVKAALMSGDIALAGQIAMAGLKLAFSQGLEALTEMIGGIGGDFAGTIIDQLIGGDFAAAWDTATIGLAAAWTSFTDWIVSAFVDSAKGLIGIVQSVLSTITGMYRSFYDTTYSFIVEKLGELNGVRTIGGNSGSAFDQSALGQLANSGLEQLGPTGPANNFLDTYKSVASQANKEASNDLENRVGGGQAKTSTRVADAQKELDELTAKAKAAREKANAEPSDAGLGPGSGGPGAGGTGGAAGTPGVVLGDAGKTAVAGFNASAILAQTQGGSGGESPMVREQRETTKKIEQVKVAIDMTTEAVRMSVDGIKGLGLYHA